MKQKVISEQHYNQEQSWYYNKIVEIQSHKLKVDIRRNAYDHQSYAKVSRWNGSEWKHVIDKPIMACKCKVVNYFDKDSKKELFEADAVELLNSAMKIIE